MGHRKLKKFAEVATFPNVFQPVKSGIPDRPFALRGKWREHFKNDNPIVLELACGRGEYTLGLARRFTHKNFIGMDIKGARIWKGAKAALNENLTHVAFIRNRIDFIEAYFDKDEVSEIWLPFPDPFPHKENRRLVSLRFIERYRNIAPKGTKIHVKTDNEELWRYALNELPAHGCKLVVSSENVYKDANKLGVERYALLTEIQTYYEKQFITQGKQIRYIEFEIASLHTSFS